MTMQTMQIRCSICWRTKNYITNNVKCMYGNISDVYKNVITSWFMKRFSSVSAYSITRRTICYFARYTLIILYRTISFNFISTRT